MRRLALLLFISILLSLFTPLSFGGEVHPELKKYLETAEPDETVRVIVVFPGKQPAANIELIKSEGARVKRQFKIIDAVAVELPRDKIDRIAKKDFVQRIEPDYRVGALLDYSTNQIGAARVWNEGAGGASGQGVDVAILDTGIASHSYLNVVKEVDFTGEGNDDGHGHGTHVAGIVASTHPTYQGVAPGARLFDVKVLNGYGYGYGSDVIAGLEWAVDNGAEIISMSLGAFVDICDGSDALATAVDRAASTGKLVVVAAGNAGSEYGTVLTPGCSRKALSVGAVDEFDAVAGFSSRGPTGDGRTKPDIVAPGVRITSAAPGNGWVEKSGTSMATPHVSGVAALLWEVNPNLTGNQIASLLKETALPLGYDANTEGAGRVDAYRAYLQLTNISRPVQNETNRTNETRKINITIPPAFLKGTAKAKAIGIPPDHWLYPLKTFLEKVDVKLTVGKDRKAEKWLELVDRRRAELEWFADKEDPRVTPFFLSECEESIRSAQAASEELDDAVRKEELKEKLLAIVYWDRETLAVIHEKLPDDKKAAVEGLQDRLGAMQEEMLTGAENSYPAKAAEWNFAIASLQLEKANELLEQGEEEKAQKALEEYTAKIDKTLSILEENAADVAVAAVESTVRASIAGHSNVLNQIYEKISERASSGESPASAGSGAAGESDSEGSKSQGGGKPEGTPGGQGSGGGGSGGGGSGGGGNTGGGSGGSPGNSGNAPGRN